jgi:hypothetical protein
MWYFFVLNLLLTVLFALVSRARLFVESGS